jgi:hypothetical protein
LRKRGEQEAGQYACHDTYEDTGIQRPIKRPLGGRIRRLG